MRTTELFALWACKPLDIYVKGIKGDKFGIGSSPVQPRRTSSGKPPPACGKRRVEEAAVLRRAVRKDLGAVQASIMTCSIMQPCVQSFNLCSQMFTVFHSEIPRCSLVELLQRLAEAQGSSQSSVPIWAPSSDSVGVDVGESRSTGGTS